MTEKQKDFLKNNGIEVINLEKVPKDELSQEDKDFIDFIESTGGTVTEIFHF